jgi:hypothetical protein
MRRQPGGLAITGAEAEIEKQLGRLADLGVTELWPIIFPVGDDPGHARRYEQARSEPDRRQSPACLIPGQPTCRKGNVARDPRRKQSTGHVETARGYSHPACYNKQ